MVYAPFWCLLKSKPKMKDKKNLKPIVTLSQFTQSSHPSIHQSQTTNPNQQFLNKFYSM
jgi:hypothetical protein